MMENAVNITIPMTIPTIAPAGSFVAPSATSGALGSPTKLIIKLYIKLLLTCNLFKGQLHQPFTAKSLECVGQVSMFGKLAW